MTFRLQTLRSADAPALARLANNKKIWDNVRDRMPYPFTLQDAEAFIHNVIRHDHALVRAIMLPGEVFAGTVGLHLQASPYEGSAELAYWLGEPFWGSGLASLAVRKLVELGFDQYNLRRIFARVYSFNKASVRVLEKNGFRCETVARAAILKNDKIWDELTFGLLQNEDVSSSTKQVSPDTEVLNRRRCMGAG